MVLHATISGWVNINCFALLSLGFWDDYSAMNPAKLNIWDDTFVNLIVYHPKALATIKHKSNLFLAKYVC